MTNAPHVHTTLKGRLECRLCAPLCASHHPLKSGVLRDCTHCLKVSLEISIEWAEKLERGDA